MSTSSRKVKGKVSASVPKAQRSFTPTTALAKDVKFDPEMMTVFFTDGRILSVPLIWFPALRKATVQQRKQYEIGGGGISLHWPELDEDLSIAGLMAGVDSQSS
ncbi:MAG TPA: DUF2442 domain-containing protein [Pirellulales bacterium]|jgi:hypothetical protein|nr:DUF2442 domain-containing protein [Pirellulales bacterium]